MVGMAEVGAPISLDGVALHPDCWCVCLCLKELKDSARRHSPGGKSFHSRGPAAKKVLLPSLFCSQYKQLRHVIWISGQRPASDRRRLSSARYMGAAPVSNWCTSPMILNMTRCRTGSQCSCCNTAVMCHHDGRLSPAVRQHSGPTGGGYMLMQCVVDGIRPGPPGWAGIRKVKPGRLKPIWIYWSKR